MKKIDKQINISDYCLTIRAGVVFIYILVCLVVFNVDFSTFFLLTVGCSVELVRSLFRASKFESKCHFTHCGLGDSVGLTDCCWLFVLDIVFLI